MFYANSTGGFYDDSIHLDGMPADAVEVSDDEYRVLLAGQSQGRFIVIDDGGVPSLQDRTPPSLAETKATALAIIDVCAGAARARYITVTPGQEATYLMKGQQARDYAAAGYTGPAPLMVAAEQEAVGDASPQVAAQRIIAEESLWAAKAAQIERERRSRKIAVAAAVDSEAVAVIRDAAEAALSAM